MRVLLFKQKLYPYYYTIKEYYTVQLIIYSAHCCQQYFDDSCTVNTNLDGCDIAQIFCMKYKFEQCKSDRKKKLNTCLERICAYSPALPFNLLKKEVFELKDVLTIIMLLIQLVLLYLRIQMLVKMLILLMAVHLIQIIILVSGLMINVIQKLTKLHQLLLLIIRNAIHICHIVQLDKKEDTLINKVIFRSVCNGKILKNEYYQAFKHFNKVIRITQSKRFALRIMKIKNAFGMSIQINAFKNSNIDFCGNILFLSRKNNVMIEIINVININIFLYLRYDCCLNVKQIGYNFCNVMICEDCQKMGGY
ncbi:unnamed protein product [Paramecium pentaurelia]|uniref:Transmembrane protein n=1 Tax=Paramecium pentaurelia TaxID=43138 RepID=A0A8S1YHK8_9CILI|nr:unnamed protein product [Paramecium pentaurelia]